MTNCAHIFQLAFMEALQLRATLTLYWVLLQAQQAFGESCVLSAERRFPTSGSMQSSLQDTQDNSLGNSTQFAPSLNQHLPGVLSPH
jgi:hypothetical protein